MNDAFHVPVMAEAVVALMGSSPPGPLVDATAGGAGHLAALHAGTGGARRLIGVDRDPEACAVTPLSPHLFLAPGQK